MSTKPLNSKPLHRHRRTLGTDFQTSFLPKNAILMTDPEASVDDISDGESSDEALTSQQKGRVLSRTQSGLVFFVTREDHSAPGAHELLFKMLQALGVNPSGDAAGSTELIELEDSGEWLEGEVDFGGNLVVVLGEEAAMRLGILDSGGVRAIVTHSLQSLMQQPQLKRESWQHLQVAAREAGWAIPAR
jgi:hypothetical protein